MRGTTTLCCWVLRQWWPPGQGVAGRRKHDAGFWGAGVLPNQIQGHRCVHFVTRHPVSTCILSFCGMFYSNEKCLQSGQDSIRLTLTHVFKLLCSHGSGGNWSTETQWLLRLKAETQNIVIFWEMHREAIPSLSKHRWVHVHEAQWHSLLHT